MTFVSSSHASFYDENLAKIVCMSAGLSRPATGAYSASPDSCSWIKGKEGDGEERKDGKGEGYPPKYKP